MSELTTFIQKSNSFERRGCHDDLAMCLVIYAWLVLGLFQRITDQDVRKNYMMNKRIK